MWAAASTCPAACRGAYLSFVNPTIVGPFGVLGRFLLGIVQGPFSGMLESRNMSTRLRFESLAYTVSWYMRVQFAYMFFVSILSHVVTAPCWLK